jgi:RNA-directed DNA polymerase
MVRHERNFSELWRKLPWKKFQSNLFRLQKRVFKAVREGHLRKARSLQKLILKSQSARLIAIRQVTQLNAGKKTAGIDGKASLTFEERLQLDKFIQTSTNSWHHQGLRQIPIPKKDGTMRLLKVPTVYPYCTSFNRFWECFSHA